MQTDNRQRNVYMLRICLLVILVASMTGCAAMRAEEHATAVLGKTKVELLSCAGVPLREYQEGDLTFLTYSVESGKIVGMSRIGRGPGMLAGASHQCEATVTLRDSKVTQVQYRSTARNDGPCEPIFRGCAGP